MKKENKNNDYIIAQRIVESLTESAKSGRLTHIDTVEKWLNENEFAKDTLTRLSDVDHLNNESEICSKIRGERADQADRFKADLLSLKNKRIVRLRLFVASVSIAAVILISLFIYPIVERQDLPLNSEIDSFNYITSQPIENSVLTPIILLGDGSSIDLTTTTDTIPLIKTGAIIKSGNTLKYNATQNSEAEYNTLVVPSMYIFVITLIDGTEVTLNANSTMRYPTKFVGDEREVYLTGEAYFNVKKDAKPFIVHCADVDIKVYGTEFNVDASSRNVVKTVLVSGSVGVKINDNELFVKPNQMLICNLEMNSTELENVDCAKYTAWKNGFFRCDNDQLVDLLKDISKWYNISFKYDSTVLSLIKTTASLSRDLPLEEILKSIEIMENIKFIKMEGGEYQIK